MPAPKTQPVAKPAEDDLFNDSTKPAPKAPTNPAEDDLFDSGPAKPAMPAKPSAPTEDNLFDAGTPTEKPAPASSPLKKDDIDSLFDEDNGAKPAPTKAPAPKKPAESADDLFGLGPEEPASPSVAAGSPESPRSPAIEAAPQVAESDASGMRWWTDDTGQYRVFARIDALLDGKVRLLKDTGRYTTVPFERLSGHDADFVNQYARAKSHEAPSDSPLDAPVPLDAPKVSSIRAGLPPSRPQF